MGTVGSGTFKGSSNCTFSVVTPEDGKALEGALRVGRPCSDAVRRMTVIPTVVYTFPQDFYLLCFKGSRNDHLVVGPVKYRRFGANGTSGAQIGTFSEL